MPSPMETSDLHQKAVFYEADGYDNYGEPKVKAGVEIDVRWITGKKESIDAEGSTIAIDSTVAVDRTVPVGSAMWLGTLASLPSPVTDIKTVIDYKETPDIKGREARRVVTLMKLSDELPTFS